MKKKLLILSACIGLILACFPFTLYAEEDPESDLGISSPPAYYQLDSYFYENYDLLPYVESDGTQYVSTGVNVSPNLITDVKFSFLEYNANYEFIFGAGDSNASRYGVQYRYDNENLQFFYIQNQLYSFIPNNYQIYDVKLDKNDCYLNGSLVHSFTYNSSLSSSYPLYIFAGNIGGSPSTKSKIRLYEFSIYDYSANNGEGEYVRYYYPARAKSGGIIGLYDAVNNTFITTLGSTPFENPVGSSAEMSITAKITSFIYNSLGWIGDILGFAITEPLIIIFMAIGLAGAMFRWGRRLVHF